MRKFSTIEINTNILKDYLKRRHLISPEDHPIKGIKQLLPGTHIKFKTHEWISSTVERRYLSELLDKELFKEIEGFKPKNEKYNKGCLCSNGLTLEISSIKQGGTKCFVGRRRFRGKQTSCYIGSYGKGYVGASGCWYIDVLISDIKVLGSNWRYKMFGT